MWNGDAGKDAGVVFELGKEVVRTTCATAAAGNNPPAQPGAFECVSRSKRHFHNAN